MRPKPTLATLALVTAFVPSRTLAQDVEIDRAELLVYTGSRQVARESFVISAGDGTLSVRTRLEGVTWTRSLTAESRFRSDSTATGTRVEGTRPSLSRIEVRFSDSRISLRSLSTAGERAREFPKRGRVLVADDSIPSLYAILPGNMSGSLTLISPMSGERSAVDVVDHGISEKLVRGERRPLRHIELRSPAASRHLWLDSNGLLMVFESPAANIRAVRVLR